MALNDNDIADLDTFYYGNAELAAIKTKYSSDYVFVYITGMKGKLLDNNLAIYLKKFCVEQNYIFTQPLFRSHPFYSLYTLRDDSQDLSEFLQQYKIKKVILVGFSTGCQSIIYYLKSNNDVKNIEFVVFFGPVSDRNYEEVVRKKELDEGMSKHSCLLFNDELFCRERFCDLYRKYGRDDMFSYDLSDFFFQRLNPKNIPFYFILAGKDKFVFNTNEGNLKLIPNSNVFVLDKCGHFLKTNSEIDKFAFIFEAIVSTKIKKGKSEFIYDCTNM